MAEPPLPPSSGSDEEPPVAGESETAETAGSPASDRRAPSKDGARAEPGRPDEIREAEAQNDEPATLHAQSDEPARGEARRDEGAPSDPPADPTSREPTAPVDARTPRPEAPRGSLPKRALGLVVAFFAAGAEGLTRFANAGLAYLWPYLLGAIGLGSAIWFAKHQDHLPEQLTNKIAWDLQLKIVRSVAGSFAGILSVLALVLAVVRIRTGAFHFTRTASRLAPWITSLVAAPLVVGLFTPQIEAAHALVTLLFCALVALVVGVSVYRGLALELPWSKRAHPSEAPERSLADRLGPVLVTATLAFLWVGYGAFFSRLAITNHHGLATRTTDLGYYDNIFYQSIHGHFLGCSFIKAGYHGSAHFDPILVLLSPLYLLYPRAEFILSLQSYWLGSAVIPLYLLSRHHGLGRVASCVVAACFTLHPAIHGANMYEFHSLTLANVPILWVIYLLETNRMRAFFPVAFAMLLVREDMSLVMCFLCIAAMMRFPDRRRTAAFVMILVSIAYFGVTKAFFMTSAEIFQAGPEAYSYAYYYEELTPNNKGFGGFLVSLATNPAFVVSHVFEEAKMLFLFTIFLPLLLLPFLARKGKLALAYGLFFTLMATRTAVFSTHFQYSTTIVPIAFSLVPPALARIRESATLRSLGWSTERLTSALVAAMLVSSLVVTIKFGGIVDNQSFRGGFNRVTRVLSPQEKELYDWIDQTQRSIPRTAAVAATDKLGPHISNRMKAYFYGDTKPVDYVFVDEHDLRPERLKVLQNDVQRGALVEVARKGTYALFQTATGKPRLVPNLTAPGPATHAPPGTGRPPVPPQTPAPPAPPSLQGSPAGASPTPVGPLGPTRMAPGIAPPRTTPPPSPAPPPERTDDPSTRGE